MKTLDNLSPDLRARLSRIRMVILDVDGVLTDGVLRLDENGVESKAFHTRDGFALVWIKRFGLRTGVISGRHSKATEMRCGQLHFDEIHLGQLHKLPILEEIVKRTGIPTMEIAYLGDDLLDLPVMQMVGVSAAPSDAHREVLSRVDVVLDAPGGHGAVRHFLDLWLMATGRYESALEDIMHGRY